MKSGRLSDPAERRILAPEQLDDLGAAIIALTRELWVVTDRMILLEQLLERHGVPIADLDMLQPDERTTALLDTRREKLLTAVLTALKAGDPG